MQVVSYDEKVRDGKSRGKVSLRRGSFILGNGGGGHKHKIYSKHCSNIDAIKKANTELQDFL
jgi:hypothetical protein